MMYPIWSYCTQMALYRSIYVSGIFLATEFVFYANIKAKKMPSIVRYHVKRYNPGPLRTGNDIIGIPKESKFGISKDQLLEGYKKARDFGCTRLSLHTMIVSNCLDLKELLQTASMMFALVQEIKVRILALLRHNIIICLWFLLLFPYRIN